MPSVATKGQNHRGQNHRHAPQTLVVDLIFAPINSVIGSHHVRLVHAGASPIYALLAMALPEVARSIQRESGRESKHRPVHLTHKQTHQFLRTI